MNTATKLGGLVAGLVVALGVAAGTGVLTDPAPSASPGSAEPGHADAHGRAPGTATPATTGAERPGGLRVSDQGYTLTLDSPTAPRGAGVALRFQILGPDGTPQTAYETTHDKDLHLIVVRRDMTGYQHLHPVLDEDGTWTAPVDLEPGRWRVVADFTPSGATGPLALGADLVVDGEASAQPLPQPATTTEVNGYRVELDGALVPGRAATLTFTVTQDGRPVTDLQPYLGAFGHLVVLRAEDLAYLHVHPVGDLGDGATQPGPDIAFSATAPTAGTYRLFLDFQHDDVVHTAELTAGVDPDARVVDDTDTDHGDAHDH